MSRLPQLIVALLLAASAVEGQRDYDFEIGVILGATMLEGAGSVTTVGFPASGGALGPGALYAAEVRQPWIFEVHLALNHVSGSGTTFTQTYAGGQVDYRLSRDTSKTPYVFANFGTTFLSGDLEGREDAIGGGLGYRLSPKSAFTVRLEVRYRRWLDSRLNEYGLILGAGVRI